MCVPTDLSVTGKHAIKYAFLYGWRGDRIVTAENGKNPIVYKIYVGSLQDV
jgi:hypothetical protein